MYLFHQRWRKTTPAAHQEAETGSTAAPAGTARSDETIRFEDLETLRAAAPLIGLNQTDVRVIEVLAAAAKSGLTGLSARISDGWLASAAGLDPEALSLSLGRLSVVKLVTLPEPSSLALRGRANRKTYDLSPLMQRLPELEWLLEAAERKRDEGALPECTPDSFRDVLEDNDAPAEAAALPGFLGAWTAAAQPAGEEGQSTRSFSRKTAAPRRGLLRQALSKRLAPRRTPRAPRSGRCPSPAAASPTFRKRQARPAMASQSLSDRLLEGLQAWQKALGAAFGIRPVPVPALAPVRPPVRPRGYPGMYNDAYWTQWNEEKSHTYS